MPSGGFNLGGNGPIDIETDTAKKRDAGDPMAEATGTSVRADIVLFDAGHGYKTYRTAGHGNLREDVMWAVYQKKRRMHLEFTNKM